eukprot:CAMPEP_0206524182 /NCGR_PEP_ID=MMETSP0324_2-20121206/68043_1 /ASSEMBLY_ACC=CAM_ASM_000836 /TAXON_ID=2866 /ORGANISM="Crypthecodinium cohnii, Strain Seligo" /LENGTH=428 /DNA_ID=CAMNT_0054018723 /DNA_START=61 /DNA_END=1347 /DNA_ORIENTATION=+
MSGLWEIVGGADKGGIMVRDGSGLKSAALEERLSTGALVKELERSGDRLKYRLESGSGPVEGWISVRISGKELAVPKADDGALAATTVKEAEIVAEAASKDNTVALPNEIALSAAPAEEAYKLWEGLREKVQQAAPVASNLKEAKPWLVPAKPGTSKPPARVRLVYFDWTGNRGGAGAVNGTALRANWEKWLSEVSPAETWEVVKVEYPGRGMRPKEPNATSTAEIAAGVVECLGKAGSLAATVLMGFSFGAILAYETAALMAAKGHPILGLVTVSAEHPGWAGRLEGAGAKYGATKDMSKSQFEALLKEKRGVPEMILQMPQAVEAIRSDMLLEESYASSLPQHPKLPCPIVAYRGTNCPHIKREDVEPWMECSALGAAPPSRVAELSSGLKPTGDQHWLSDWYLCQGEASVETIVKSIGQDFAPKL